MNRLCTVMRWMDGLSPIAAVFFLSFVLAGWWGVIVWGITVIITAAILGLLCYSIGLNANRGNFPS